VPWRSRVGGASGLDGVPRRWGPKAMCLNSGGARSSAGSVEIGVADLPAEIAADGGADWRGGMASGLVAGAMADFRG